MFDRLNRFIAREKAKSPNSSVATLIVKRAVQIADSRLTQFFVAFKKDSTFTSEKDLYMCSLFPQKVLDIVIHDLHPKSVLDVGCGVGLSLEYYSKNGLDAVGVENSKLAISQSPVKEKIIQFNLTKELNLKRQFDLVWCFEVIEHIHPDYETAFLKTLTNHGSNILLSAARPGQGGHGHFNEQLPAYWIAKFKQLGYEYNEAFTEKVRGTNETHCENLLFFQASKS